jgi:hypothetical protein
MSRNSSSIDRPEFCPTCGVSIGPFAVIVQINKGPWTCEACDGKTRDTEVNSLETPKPLTA